jgi:holliday junction DNA helicase RuvA
MIAQIRGHLVQKRPGLAIVEANGIGYQIFVSLTTFYDLPETDESVKLHTHTHVREDVFQLYGFSTLLEKDLFQILIGVSGIGPKLALNILSKICTAKLIQALSTGNVDCLLSVPGIGRKTAERMIIDLQEKARKIESKMAVPQTVHLPADGVTEDVISALVNLGYKKNQAEKAVENAIKENPERKLEKILRMALQTLAKE